MLLKDFIGGKNMSKEFPRKEVWMHTTQKPLRKNKILAVCDEEISLTDYFRGYSDGRWASDNVGWTSSLLPSSVEVESGGDFIVIHCGLNEYKNLIGMVKLAIETKIIPVKDYIGGLSTEIMPLTSDEIFILEKRIKGTQHGLGFWDIPSASQNAQMWLDKIPKEYSGLVKDLFDMDGFPRWNLIRNMALRPEEIGEIFYTGFSKGAEVSLDSQYNGYTKINLEHAIIRDRMLNSAEREERAKNLLFYRLKDLPAVFDSIGKSGKRGDRVKEDFYGNVPTENKQTEGFAIVDDCLGTLLSNANHLFGPNAYIDGLNTLKSRGYKINNVPIGKTILADLK